MTFTELPLFRALKSKMQWHQTRQSVLAGNIAHSDTPGYQSQDLKSYSFDDHVRGNAPGVTTSVTASGHIAAGNVQSGKFGTERQDSFEITPSGNGVNLEEQMMKITQNQMDFQAATSLYTKGLGIIRTALSKSV